MPPRSEGLACRCRDCTSIPLCELIRADQCSSASITCLIADSPHLSTPIEWLLGAGNPVRRSLLNQSRGEARGRFLARHFGPSCKVLAAEGDRVVSILGGALRLPAEQASETQDAAVKTHQALALHFPHILSSVTFIATIHAVCLIIRSSIT